MESVGRGTTKMPQFCLQLAGLSVSVASQYSQVEHMCSGYEVPKGASSDIDVRIDPQDIDAERDEGAWSDAYLETLAVYRQIAEALPAFDRMLVHGALLSFQGEGYLFAAPSGTGKSTHALLWKRFLGDAVSIVNGDKPIVRLTGEGDVPVAYGTPWAGKEGWHENASAASRRVFSAAGSNEQHRAPGRFRLRWPAFTASVSAVRQPRRRAHVGTVGQAGRMRSDVRIGVRRVA